MKYRNLIFIGIVFLMACDSTTEHTEYIRRPDTTACWIDFRIGELPPANYYDATDSIIRKWNLCYKRIEGGCEATVAERNQHEKGNEKYFAILAAKYGKNWIKRFNKEVRDLDSILRNAGSPASANGTVRKEG